jgi:regulatory protein
VNTNYKTYTVEEALSRLQNYCAYQERCHQEVHNKLKEMRMIPEAIDQIIVDLINNNYLNESRFAQTFVNDKFRLKSWGKYRLVSELRKKGISKVNINFAIEKIDYKEYVEVFNALAEKRLLQINETNVLKKKKKLCDYLVYRGWESDLVYSKASELIKY